MNNKSIEQRLTNIEKDIKALVKGVDTIIKIMNRLNNKPKNEILFHEKEAILKAL